MQYDELMKILKNRRTARLVSKDSIPKDDIQKIIEAGKLAPSVDKLYNYRVYALTNSTEGVLMKKGLMRHFRCNNASPDDPLGGGEIIQPIMSGLTLIYTITISYTDPKSAPAARDAMINATFSMLAAESLGYKTGFFGIVPDRIGSRKVINPVGEVEYLLLAVTCATESFTDPGSSLEFDYESTHFIYDHEQDKAWAHMIEGDENRSFVHLMKHHKNTNSAEFVII